MVKLLTDEHISPAVVRGLHRQHSKLLAFALKDWEQGSFLGEPDHLILHEAARQKLTFVTYDLKTIPPLLKLWAEEGKSHNGVIFIDEKSIAPNDIGTLVRALSAVINETPNKNWRNRILFLQP